MIVRIELDDDGAHSGGFSENSRNGPICKLARTLMASGTPGDAMAEIYRGETLCFKPAPIGSWAKLTVSETDRSFRFATWSPMPKAAFE